MLSVDDSWNVEPLRLMVEEALAVLVPPVVVTISVPTVELFWVMVEEAVVTSPLVLTVSVPPMVVVEPVTVVVKETVVTPLVVLTVSVPLIVAPINGGGEGGGGGPSGGGAHHRRAHMVVEPSEATEVVAVPPSAVSTVWVSSMVEPFTVKGVVKVATTPPPAMFTI